MLAIGNQVKIIGELHRFGNFLKDVNTEPLAALFDVTWLLICFVPNRLKKQTNKQTNKQTKQGFIQEAAFILYHSNSNPNAGPPFHSSAQCVSDPSEEIDRRQNCNSFISSSW